MNSMFYACQDFSVRYKYLGPRSSEDDVDILERRVCAKGPTVAQVTKALEEEKKDDSKWYSRYEALTEVKVRAYHPIFSDIRTLLFNLWKHDVYSNAQRRGQFYAHR